VLNETGQIVAALTVSLTLPIIVIGARLWRERDSISVTAKITSIEEVEDEDGINYYPKFEVVSGPYAGVTYRSESNCGPSTYLVGEYVPAKLFPHTGEIFGDNRAISNWLVWFSPFIVILVFVIADRLF